MYKIKDDIDKKKGSNHPEKVVVCNVMYVVGIERMYI